MGLNHHGSCPKALAWDIEGISCDCPRGWPRKDKKMLQIGQVLHGFCGGAFGSDSYECKRIEAVGFDWVVARNIDRPSTPNFAEGIGLHLKLEKFVVPKDCDCELQ